MTAPRRAASARRSKAEKAAEPPSIPKPAEVVGGASGSSAAVGALADSESFDGQYRIKLESFEGPLDLLLHLIQQHELDILNIPVSFITEKYLEYLKLMQVLSIEIASEYLVMAATLVHIKSKMLLPVEPSGQDDGMPQEEEEDPRAELVRRLLEYQKYKAAAAELAERGTLGRDVFARGVEEATPPGPAELARLEVFSLLEAFERILKKTKVKIDHEVVFDRISITDRIVELTEKLQGRRAVRFEWLFLGASRDAPPTRFDLVITFLAMLEMCRMKLLRVYQTGPLAPIYMGLIEEGGELSDEDRALADTSAEERIAELPDVAPENDASPDAAAPSPADETPMEPAEATPMKAVEEAAAEPVPETRMEPVDETPMEAVEEAAAEPVPETQMEPVDETPMEAVEEAAAEPVPETRMEPVEETRMEPVEETPMEPVEETPKGAVEETPMEPVEASPTEAAEEPSMEAVEETAAEPAGEGDAGRLDAGPGNGSNDAQDAAPSEADEVNDDG